MTGCISETYCKTAVRQGLPVEVIAPGFIGRLIPCSKIKIFQTRRLSREKALLYRSGNVEIVVHLVELALKFSFSKGCSHVQANPMSNKSSQDAADRKSTRLNSSHSQISYAVFC